MIKKAVCLLLSLGILYTGYLASVKLNYWERSIRIFAIGNSEFPGMGRGGGEYGRSDGPGESHERERFTSPEGRGGAFQRNGMPLMNDSTRADYGRGREQSGMAGRNIPDSLRRQLRPGNEKPEGRLSFEGGMPGRGGRDHGDFAGGKNVNLRNVWWFLAVFASFTVIAVYIDSAYCTIRKRGVTQ